MRPTFAGGFFRDERVRAPTPWSATGAVGGPASGIFLGSAPRPPFVTSFSTFFLSPGAALLLADERLRVEGAMVVSAEDAPTLPARIARCPRTRRPRCRALSVPSFRVAERRAPSRRGLPRVDARAVCFEKTGDASTLNSRGARKPSARARSKRRRRAGRLGTSDRALFTVRDPSFFPDPRSTGASERLTPTKSRFTAPGRDRPLLSAQNLVAADDEQQAAPSSRRSPSPACVEDDPSTERHAGCVSSSSRGRARCTSRARRRNAASRAMDAPASDARDAAAARGASALDAAACIPRDVETPGAPPPPPPGAPLARDASPARPWRALAAETPYALPARSPRAEAPPHTSLARTLARYVPARSTEAPPSRGVVDDRASRREPPVEPPSDARLASGSLAGPAYYDASLASSERHWAEALLDAAERKRRRERRRKRGRVAAEESTLRRGGPPRGMRQPRGAVASASAPANGSRVGPRVGRPRMRSDPRRARPPRPRRARDLRALVRDSPRPRTAASPRRRIRRCVSRRKARDADVVSPSSSPPSAIVGYQDEWLEAPIDRVAIAPQIASSRRAVRAEGGRRKPVALALVAPEEEEEEEEEEEGARYPPGARGRSPRRRSRRSPRSTSSAGWARANACRARVNIPVRIPVRTRRRR